MMNQMLNQLQSRIRKRLCRMRRTDRRRYLAGCMITFDDWLLMHRLRRKAFFHGIINYQEFVLLNSWLGIDHTHINKSKITLRILMIGTFQHIAMRLYEEKITIN